MRLAYLNLLERRQGVVRSNIFSYVGENLRCSRLDRILEVEFIL
jgi:hypothetical protein